MTELLDGIVRVAGDGFCPVESLYYEFVGHSRRDVSTALRRADAGGYLILRRGPEGRRHVALSSEGWALQRAPRDPAG